MTELPEVLTIARQMNEELSGKTIEFAIQGDSLYKIFITSEEQNLRISAKKFLTDTNIFCYYRSGLELS